MKQSATVIALTLLISAAACADRNSPLRGEVMAPNSPDILSPNDRASLRPGVNVPALEKFLASIPGDQRSEFLTHFKVGGAPIVSAADPNTDKIVKGIWARSGESDTGLDPSNAERAANRKISVAIGPNLASSNVGALIIRHAHEDGDIVLLSPSHMNVVQLSAALHTLIADRIEAPVIETDRKVEVPITNVRASPDATVQVLQAHFGAILDALKSAPRKDVGGVGNVQLTSLIVHR